MKKKKAACGSEEGYTVKKAAWWWRWRLWCVEALSRAKERERLSLSALERS